MVKTDTDKNNFERYPQRIAKADRCLKRKPLKEIINPKGFVDFK
jgi:hypothetical protein